MSFSGQSWAKRLEGMGDASEGKFLEVAEQLGRRPVRFGFDRPPFSIVKIAKKLRYTPDYIDDKGLIECQGFGRDQVFKLKVEKLSALAAWDAEHPVHLFLWDSAKKRYLLVALSAIQALIDSGSSSMGYFPDGKGKAYFAVPAAAFDGWIAA